VTDRHLLIVHGSVHETLALEDIESATGHPDGFMVMRFWRTKGISYLLRVDERAAVQAVAGWLQAIARHNAPRFRQAEMERAQEQREAAKQLRAQQIELAEEDRRLSARKALRRLEKLIERKRLGIDERAWLIRLAEQAQALEAARTGKGKKRS